MPGTCLAAEGGKIMDRTWIALITALLSIPGDRYEYEMNILLKCRELKIPLKEIPIRTVYIDDNASSHFDAVKDSMRIYKEILSKQA